MLAFDQATLHVYVSISMVLRAILVLKGTWVEGGWQAAAVCRQSDKKIEYKIAQYLEM
jgi:hypothetical protein